MVELLPDLGAAHVWDTDATVAPSEFEQAGNEFTIRAYSALFMDVGPSDLLLRVLGYDGAGNAALLPVQTVDAGRRRISAIPLLGPWIRRLRAEGGSEIRPQRFCSGRCEP